PVTIFGDGLQTRDFVFVGDVVAANRLALTLEGTFNVATGVETSVLDVVKMLERSVGKEIQVNHAPAINGELRRSCLSAQRLQNHGWFPKVSLQDGMQQIVDFFKK
ncbi:MAG: GDP-mannose 4,6-dehydratase, partial [Nanoarchaeota archaeon]|nr:GDP-mannose 4,6-dehydratase [Nanoarchaeota archaeon]